MDPNLKNLAFRCTGCGSCCREPLLPLTDVDLRRIVRHTQDAAAQIVRWVSRTEIELDDEPEAFVELRQGKRAMVLRQRSGACIYLGPDDRCTIYAARPLGCRLYPFEPSYDRKGKLVRLKIVEATESCPYELDGRNDPGRLRLLKTRYDAAYHRYYRAVETWNARQRARRQAGKRVETARAFLEYLGF